MSCQDYFANWYYSKIRAFREKNFRYSMGAPWAGAQGASGCSYLLPELAMQRDGPSRPSE